MPAKFEAAIKEVEQFLPPHSDNEQLAENENSPVKASSDGDSKNGKQSIETSCKPDIVINGNSQQKSKSKPRWDKVTGKLTFGDEVIKVIKNKSQAKNVMAILDSFHGKQWPRTIPSPFRGEQHANTLKSLNKNLAKLVFFSDGASNIRWEIRENRRP